LRLPGAFFAVLPREEPQQVFRQGDNIRRPLA
jgi:hypothetical protein